MSEAEGQPRPPVGADDAAPPTPLGADERYSKKGKLRTSVYEAEMEGLQEQLVLLPSLEV